MSAEADDGREGGCCTDCVRRSWLLARLGPVLDRCARDHERLLGALALPDEQLIDALAGSRRDSVLEDYRAFRPGGQTGEADMVCAHRRAYPRALACHGAPPPLHVAGGVVRLGALTGAPVVAVLGHRAPSDYGSDVSRSLARGLAVSGVTVASTLGAGIGACAQEGVLETGSGALALAGDGLAVAARGRSGALLSRVARSGCVVSALPGEEHGRRWGRLAAECWAARLAQLVIVVEAEDDPRQLAPARLAGRWGATVAAVPGRVTSTLAAGPNALLAEGAALLRGPGDALELLHAPPARPAAGAEPAPAASLEPDLRSLLEQVGDGRDTLEALLRGSGAEPEQVLLGLTRLELLGLLGRGRGGRYLRRL